MKSEFGKGLVICLVKFAEHFQDYLWNLSEINNWIKHSENIDSNNTFYKDWMSGLEIWKTPEMFLSSRIQLFFYAASDHLKDIEVPNDPSWKKIKKSVDYLQSKGLKISHGFSNTIWTYDDVIELTKLTEEIALMVDKKLGLFPDIGEY